MKSTSVITLLLALTTLGLAVWSWEEHEEIVQFRADAAAQSATLADLQKRWADAQKRLKALYDQIAALRGRSRRGGDEAATTGDAAGPAPRRNGGFRAMMNNPQFQRLMAIQQRAMLDSAYAPLFKSLNLTPQQLDLFKNLMVQRQQAVMDAMQAAREQGIDPRTDPTDFQQAIAQAEAAVDSQIQATLGDAGYAAYQQYQQTLPQRNTTTQLQTSLSYTSTPLTDDQANQLIQILAQTSPANSGGGGGRGLYPGGPGGPGGGAGAAQITDQAITLAQGVLSAPQVQALQQLQQQQQARQQMQQLMRASMGGGGGGGGGGG